jgi:hypothetical protein
MCWVAVDRAVRLATKRSFPSDLVRWHQVRDTIYRDIYERGLRAAATLSRDRSDPHCTRRRILLLFALPFLAGTREKSALLRPMSVLIVVVVMTTRDAHLPRPRIPLVAAHECLERRTDRSPT